MTVKKKAGPGKGKGAPNAKGGGAGTAKAGRKRGKGKKKDKLECGENGTYGDLKKKTGKGKFDRDHVPSKAALKERARTQLRGGKSLCPKQAKAVDNLAKAIAIPKSIHSAYSPTHGSGVNGNNPAKILKDSLNPRAAARRDTAAILKGMKKDGVSKECRKKYAQWAKKINDITPKQYDKMLKDAIGK